MNKTSGVPLAGYRGLLVLWIFVMSAVAYVGRVNIAIAGQAIAYEFHLTNIQLGWVFSAFVLGYALFQVPAGRLADRVGARLALALGGLWWGIFTSAVTILSPRWTWILAYLIAMRFSLGVGEAIMYPASNSFVARWIPSSERGIANGIIFAGVGFGAGVTPPVIAYMLLNYGWRASLWLTSVVAIFAGLVWFVIARDSPSEQPWMSAKEKDFICANTPILQTGPGTRRCRWPPFWATGIFRHLP